MKFNTSILSAVAIIVVALACIIQLVIPGVNWWALFLLVPIAMFIWKSIDAWVEKRRSVFVFIQIALILITILIAFFYTPLWDIIYIPILLIVGITALLAAVSKSKQ